MTNIVSVILTVVSVIALVDGELRDAAGAGNTGFWFGGAVVGIER